MVTVTITTWKDDDDTVIDLTTIPVLKYGDKICLKIRYEYDNGFTYEDKIYAHNGEELASAFYWFYVEGFEKLIKKSYETNINTETNELPYLFHKYKYGDKYIYSYIPDGQSNFSIYGHVNYALDAENDILIMYCHPFREKITNAKEVMQTIFNELNNYVLKLKSHGYWMPEDYRVRN